MVRARTGAGTVSRDDGPGVGIGRGRYDADD